MKGTGSRLQWQRLCLPGNLTGKSVLEIGCDSDCFGCFAVQLGAAQVTCVSAAEWHGLTSVADLIGPVGALNPFDLVLWRNAFDGSSRPKLIANELRDRMGADGVLVAEVTTARESSREWILERNGDELTWAPSINLVYDVFEGFAAREMGLSVDPARTVLHLTPRRPNVTLIYGMRGSGKTVRLRQELTSGSISIRIDRLLSVLSKLEPDASGADESEMIAIAAAYRSMMRTSGKDDSLVRTQLSLAGYLHDEGLLDTFAKFLTAKITDDFPNYAIEGGILTDKRVRTAVIRCLERKGMKVWCLASPFASSRSNKAVGSGVPKA